MITFILRTTDAKTSFVKICEFVMSVGAIIFIKVRFELIVVQTCQATFMDLIPKSRWISLHKGVFLLLLFI